MIQEHHLNVEFAIISEAGASVYSASQIAKEEFPDYHVEERSAVSIARRLQDPLAELVKMDFITDEAVDIAETVVNAVMVDKIGRASCRERVLRLV